MTQTLLLIRHGQASAGSANYDRLSAIGREQSQLLGHWWQRNDFAPDACYHGTLERQRDTARITLQAADLSTECQRLPALDEYNHRLVDTHMREQVIDVDNGSAPSNPESMTYHDYASIMRRWRDSPSVPEPLENWSMFAARGWQAISQAASTHPDDATIAFFTSGGIISTVLAAVLDLDFEHCIDAIWRVRNASITRFAYDGEQARLVEFNNITHLQLHQKPDLVTLI